MVSYTVGKELLSYCGRCRLSLSHIITSVRKDGKPKVQCKTCQSNHLHKSAPAKKTATRKRTKATTSRPLSEIWDDAMKKAQGTGTPYSIASTFSPQEVLSHPTFGEGIVQRLIDQNKIEVLFRDQIRILAHKR